MWIGKHWNELHTDLSIYFIEKIKQSVDYKETISKQHYSTSGYILIAEIAKISAIVKKSPRYKNRLISIVKEDKSELIKSSIVNDYILKKYHPDIVAFYRALQVERLKDEGFRNGLILKNKVFLTRLNGDYYKNIIYDLNLIDFESSKYNRYSDRIDNLIKSLVPYLLFKGVFSNKHIRNSFPMGW